MLNNAQEVQSVCSVKMSQEGARDRGLANADAPEIEQQHLKTVVSSLNYKVKLRGNLSFWKEISQVTKESLNLEGHRGKKILER